MPRKVPPKNDERSCVFREGLPGIGRKAIDKDLIDDGVAQPCRNFQAIDIEFEELRRRLAEQTMEIALVKGVGLCGQFGRGQIDVRTARQSPPSWSAP